MLYIISIPFLLGAIYNLYKMKANSVRERVDKHKIIRVVLVFLAVSGINYYLKGSKEYYLLLLSALIAIISCLFSAGISSRSISIYRGIPFLIMSIKLEDVDTIELKESDALRLIINASGFIMTRVYSLSDKSDILQILGENDIKYSA